MAKMIEEKVLEELMSGSYEKRMQVLQKEVRSEMGDGVAIVASFPGRITLIEGDSFFNVEYKIDDKNGGKCVLGKKRGIDIALIDEDSQPGKIVEQFFHDGNLSGLDEMIVSAVGKDKTEIELMEDRAGNLFSDCFWIKYLNENRDSMTGPAFDKRIGSVVYPKIISKFDNLTEENSESKKGSVIENLESIEGQIVSLQEKADLSFEEYKVIVGGFGNKKANLDLVESFDSFATDYLDNLQSVERFISESLESVKVGGCVLCGAMAHDVIAEMAQDLELGSRLIQRVSLEFARNKVQEDN
jgi:hypothetical protein